MSYQNITAGTKTAKAKAARFIESKAGTLGMEVAFTFVEPTTNSTEQLNWVGWLTEKSTENTMKTLVEVLDFNGDDTVGEGGVLVNPQALNYSKEVSLVIEFEQNPENGKQYPKIKWVNNVGGSAFAACAPEVIKGKLHTSGFKAAFLAAKQGTPKPQGASGPLHSQTPGVFNEGKLPF